MTHVYIFNYNSIICQFKSKSISNKYLDLQSVTFTGSGAGLPTPPFFWILSGSFFEDKPTTDAMILLAKCARLPVPLFSHSTGFSMARTGSIRSACLGDLLNEIG